MGNSSSKSQRGFAEIPGNVTVFNSPDSIFILWPEVKRGQNYRVKTYRHSKSWGIFSGWKCKHKKECFEPRFNFLKPESDEKYRFHVCLIKKISEEKYVRGPTKRSPSIVFAPLVINGLSAVLKKGKIEVSWDRIKDSKVKYHVTPQVNGIDQGTHHCEKNVFIYETGQSFAKVSFEVWAYTAGTISVKKRTNVVSVVDPLIKGRDDVAISSRGSSRDETVNDHSPMEAHSAPPMHSRSDHLQPDIEKNSPETKRNMNHQTHLSQINERKPVTTTSEKKSAQPPIKQPDEIPESESNRPVLSPVGKADLITIQCDIFVKSTKVLVTFTDLKIPPVNVENHMNAFINNGFRHVNSPKPTLLKISSDDEYLCKLVSLFPEGVGIHPVPGIQLDQAVLLEQGMKQHDFMVLRNISHPPLLQLAFGLSNKTANKEVLDFPFELFLNLEQVEVPDASRSVKSSAGPGGDVFTGNCSATKSLENTSLVNIYGAAGEVTVKTSSLNATRNIG